MLLPAEKIEDVEYKDRTGMVRTPSPDSVFKQRYGAFLICFVGGHMLLSRSEHSGGDWELPGGGIDEGESAEQAVLRETYEETNVEFGDVAIEKKHTQRIYYFALDSKQFWNYDQDYFVLSDPSLNHHIFDGIIKSPDNCDAKWIKISDLKDTNIRHDHNKALQKLGYKD
jgi:8-oxo-dGTP diphosphatase